MPVKFGSILHLNNSGSEASLDANNLRGTTIQIDSFNSASLAQIGSGLTTAPGKRRLGTIVATTGSSDNSVRYYAYIQSGSGDTNLSGSEWTTLTNWRELVLQSSAGSVGTTNALFNHITASGNISASGNGSFTGTLRADGNVDFNGDLDVDGTTNLDAVDIDNHITIANNKEIKQEDSSGTGRTIIELDNSNDLNIGGSYAGSLKIIGGGSYAEVARFDDDGHFVQVSGKNITTNHITASGNISASSTSGVHTLGGKLGIGTATTPEYNLDIRGDSPVLRIADDNTVNSLSASFIWMGENNLTETRGAGLHYDGRNNKLHIVTSDNGSSISHPKDSTSRITIQETNGNVGIGTNVPSEKLVVAGNISASGVVSASTLHIKDDNLQFEVGVNTVTSIHQSTGTHNSSDFLIIDKDNSDTRAALQVQGNNGSAEVLFAASSGKVGIGTTTPTKKLQVEGNISASGDLDIDGNITGSGLLIGNKSGKHVSIDDGSLIISGGDAWIKSDNAGGESFLYLGSNENNGNKLMYISTDDNGDKMNFSIGRYTHKWSFIGGGNTAGPHTAFEIYGQDSTSEQDFSRLRLFEPGNSTARAQIHTSGSVYFNPEGPDANFGIGTTSPSTKLHVKSDDNQLARFESNDDDAKIVIKDNDTTGFHNVRDGFHSFGFDGFSIRSPLFVVSSSKDSNDVYGKVGIGTKNVSTSVLTVRGSISASGDLKIDGDIDFEGGIDINGQSNLDDVDIDGNLTVDSTNISLDANGTFNLDNANTSNGITINTAADGGTISIGHSNSTTTINDELDVTGTVDIDDTTESTSTTTGALKVDGGVGIVKNLNVGGDVKVSGTIQAEQIHTTTVTSSVLFQSGSTRFGDSSDDTHTFTGTISVSGSSAGNITTSGNISSSFTSTGSFGNIKIPDNGRINIGNSNDLQLYHDGSNSFIKDSGTGNLNYLGGTQVFQNAAENKTMMTLNAASSVELRFNDSKKFETTTDGIITTGNISASSNLFAGGGYLYLTQNDTGDNFIRYNSTDDHIAIQTMDIHLNAANGVGIGPAGGRVNSLFQYNSAKITHPNFLGISGSVPGEMSFTNIDLGGAVGTDEVSGSTIGVISFQGRTEGGKDILGDPYNPFEQTGDFSGTGSAVDIRTLAHIRGGVEVHKIPSKEPHAGFTKTGGFLSFHTGQDSASYVGSDLSSNERMRIDRRGNVGVGFGKIPRHVKMQVRNNIVISSSTFLEPVHPSDGSYSRIGLGPTLALTGLRSGSNDTGERLPQFLISQVKAGAVFNNSGDELYGRGGGSASLEIRARATDRALDTLAPSSYNFNDLIALHIRTYEQENNPELAVGDNIEDSFDINNYPHNGANFGFNMNNPDGFNVNTRQATFGLGGNEDEIGLANVINFRGNTQFRFEGNFYETETFESAFGGANDFTNYVYDLIQPPGGGDGGEEEDGVNVNDIIQLNGPTNSPIFFWTTPNPRVIQDGAFKESPLKWSWAFSPDSSTYIAGNNIVYNVTGSIISGALGGDVSDSSLYNASRSVWSASLGDGLLDYVQQTSPDGFLVSANIAVQKSASHDTNYRFPTFHDNGSYLNERDFYKWGLELNRADGGNDALAPLNLVVTSSGRFKYRDGLSGYINDGNQDIPTAIPGDTNEDNVVNVQDIVQITQFILGVSLDAQTFNENLADFDNDGSVTVQDLVQMINIILSSAESTIGEMRKRNYAINNNRVFRELRNEQRLFQGLGNDLRNAGVSLTGSTSLGTATTVSSSLRSFITSSIHFLQSGSRRQSLISPYLRYVKPKLGTGFGMNFIEGVYTSSNPLNGVVEGSTLFFDNSFKAHVTDVFLTSSRRVEYVKLDRDLPQTTISGSFFKQFKPRGFGSSKPVFSNRGKSIRNNTGMIIRQGDNRVGIGTNKPTAMLHITGSVSSSGIANNTLLKIERDDGSKIEFTDTQQIYKDKQGNVSRRKFNSKGQEVFLSGSDDSSAADSNAITFDQTQNRGIITVSGSGQQEQPVFNLAFPGFLRQQTGTKELFFTTTGTDAGNNFHKLFNTGSGQFRMGPGQASSDTKDFVISQSGDMGIRSLPTDGNALTVGGTGSFAGLVVGGGTFTSASLAAGGSGGSGGSSNFTAAGISGSFGNQRVGTTDDVTFSSINLDSDATFTFVGSAPKLQSAFNLDINLTDNTASSLRINSTGQNKILSVDTNNGAERVQMAKDLIVAGTMSGSSAIVDGLLTSNTITASEGIFLPENKKISFETEDTAIYGFSATAEEDLYLEADGDIRLRPDHDFVIHKETLEYARFDGSARSLGLGTTTPQEKLDVHGSALITGSLTLGGVNNNTILRMKGSGSSAVELSHGLYGGQLIEIINIDEIGTSSLAFGQSFGANIPCITASNDLIIRSADGSIIFHNGTGQATLGIMSGNSTEAQVTVGNNNAGTLKIQGNTDATNATGNTGVLRVDGGASIVKSLFVGTTGSFGYLTATEISASGDILTSGDIFFENNNAGNSNLAKGIIATGDLIVSASDDVVIESGDDLFITVADDIYNTLGSTNKFIIRDASNNQHLVYDQNTNKLTVEGSISASGDFFIGGLASNYVSYSNGGTFEINLDDDSGNEKIFKVMKDNEEKFSIDEDGNVLITSNDPMNGPMLQINGFAASADQHYLNIHHDGDDLVLIHSDGNDPVYVDFEQNTEMKLKGASSFLDIGGTGVATSNNGDNGALRVEGGASIAKNVFIGTHLNVGKSIVQVGPGSGNYISASNGSIELSGSGTALLEIQGDISGSATSIFTAGDLRIVSGTLDIKNLGTASQIKMYCEDNNQHFQTIKAAPHSDGASNTLVLPSVGTVFATTDGSQTFTNKTLTSPDINTPDIDGGTIDNTVIGGTTKAAGSFTTVTGTGNISSSITSTGSFGHLKIGGSNYLGDPNTLSQINESTADSSANQDKIILWDESENSWGYMTLDDLQDEIDTTGGGGGGGISFDGSTANGVLTFKDSDEATVESNLTFDGTDLTIDGDLTLKQTGSIHFNHFNTASNAAGQNFSAAGQAQGDIVKFGAVDTGTMAAGKMYYLNTSGQWVLTNASDNTAGADELLAIALGDNPTVHGMLLRGVVRLSNAPAASNVRGRAVYMHTTDGLTAVTAPSGTDNIVRIIGYLIDNTSKKIWFNPDSTWVKRT